MQAWCCVEGLGAGERARSFRGPAATAMAAAQEEEERARHSVRPGPRAKQTKTPGFTHIHPTAAHPGGPRRE